MAPPHCKQGLELELELAVWFISGTIWPQNFISILGGAHVCQETGLLLPAAQQPLPASLWSHPGAEQLSDDQLSCPQTPAVYSGVTPPPPLSLPFLSIAHTQFSDARTPPACRSRCVIVTPSAWDGKGPVFSPAAPLPRTVFVGDCVVLRAPQSLCVCVRACVALRVWLWDCEGCGLRVEGWGEAEGERDRKYSNRCTGRLAPKTNTDMSKGMI